MMEPITFQERQKQATAFLQLVVQKLAIEYGMSIEPVLQQEAISDQYSTTRAVISLKPIIGWTPQSDTEAASNDH